MKTIITQTKFLFFLLCFLFISCQTKTVINFDKYEDLSSIDKKEVDQYLEEVKKNLSKNDNEIILMFQYNCFFDKTLNINDKFKEIFPKKENVINYGQKFIHFQKKYGNVIISQSDGKKIIIPQKNGYDYVGICYYNKEDKFFIHYYNFPRLLVVE